MVDIKLTNNNGFCWHHAGDVSCRGYLVDGRGQYFEGAELCNFWTTDLSVSEFRRRLTEANGCFAVVIQKPQAILAAVDRVRSMPLFYSQASETLLSDDGQSLSEGNLDKNSGQEFLLTGFVTANKTLVHDVRQLEAGEILVIDKSNRKPLAEPYFQFDHGGFSSASDEELFGLMDGAYRKVFEDLVEGLRGRTAVVPLSGGYDSRLIAFMLKELEYSNVLCFTYGHSDSKDAMISKQVADQLGMDWHFVEYTDAKWKQWFNSDGYRDYAAFASNKTSLAHLQDYPAVMMLKNLGIVPQDAIFVPGHSGDFIAGSHIPDAIRFQNSISRNDLVRQILDYHFVLWPRTGSRHFQEVDSQIEPGERFTSEEAANVFEKWDWKERQAKFIVNSVRVYEHFGFQWRIPLWSNQLFEFWSHIPITHRFQRRLYVDYVNNRVPLGIAVHAKPVKADTRLQRALAVLQSHTLVNPIYKCLRHLFRLRRVCSYSKDENAFYGCISRSEYVKGLLLGATDINSFLARWEISRLIADEEFGDREE